MYISYMLLIRFIQSISETIAKKGGNVLQVFISEKASQMKPSSLVSLLDKGRQLAQSGADVLSFAGGEPDFDTPGPISEELFKSIELGHTHYADSAGLPILRQRIAKKLLEENSIQADWRSQILITPGAKYSLFLAMAAVLNPGDEVLVFEPAWVSYRELILWCGAVPVSVPLQYEDNYTISAELLEQYITSKTKLMILNSPNNPSGRVLNEKEISAIISIVDRYKFLVLVDEIYEKINYGINQHFSLGSCKEIADYVITVNGLSKGYAMTGWRVGYLCAHPELVKVMKKILQNTITCIPAFIQEASVKAFDVDADVESMRIEYQRRRDFIVSELNSMKTFECTLPEGAFYVFPRFNMPGKNSWQAADEILEKCRVLVAPGAVFGANNDSCIRMSYATSMANLEEAMKRLKEAYC